MENIIFPVTISKINFSGGACPYQMEFETTCGKWGYLRYRGGFLRCGVVKNENDFWNGPNKWNYNVIDECIGDEYDGMPDDELFKEKLKDKLILPNGFKFSY